MTGLALLSIALSFAAFVAGQFVGYGRALRDADEIFKDMLKDKGVDL